MCWTSSFWAKHTMRHASCTSAPFIQSITSPRDTSSLLSYTQFSSLSVHQVRPSASVESKQRHIECVSEFAHPFGDHLTLLNIYNAFEEVAGWVMPACICMRSCMCVYVCVREEEGSWEHLCEVLYQWLTVWGAVSMTNCMFARRGECAFLSINLYTYTVKLAIFPSDRNNQQISFFHFAFIL